MEELVNFIKGLIKSGVDRLKFPVFNSFIFSWLILNWKPLFIILFSEEPIELRINHVSIYYSNIYTTLICPLIIAIVYTFGLPYVRKQLYSWFSEIHKNNRTDNYEYKKTSYTDRIELARKKAELNLAKTGSNDIADLRSKLSLVNSDLETARKEKEDLSSRIQVMNKEEKYFTSKIGEYERKYDGASYVIGEFSKFSNSVLKLAEEKIKLTLKLTPQNFEEIRNDFYSVYELKMVFVNNIPSSGYSYDKEIENILDTIEISKQDLKNTIEFIAKRSNDPDLNSKSSHITQLLQRNILFKAESLSHTDYGLTDLGIALHMYLRKQ
tara:strand:- start:3756 stop:4730 length:975 start_codon:yes stop_codon:yes gene_type:complete